MSSSAPTIRWGILATGLIAETFTKDLLVDPSSRGVDDIKHTVVAAASSSSISRAEEFLKKCGAPSDAKAYGSYEELVKDSNIDIIYVATPHSHHYQNTRLCLEAGKPVLCEKAFTMNAEQARKLYEVAKQKGLFLMEAVWVRYFPLSIKVREMIQEGQLGAVYRTIADLSTYHSDEWGTTHRMVNKDLAGGALLDLGIYPLTWVFQTLYHTVPASERKAPKVLAQMALHPETGADENTAMLLQFPVGPGSSSGSKPHIAQGVATTSLRVGPTDEGRPAIRIQGEKGEIQVDYPTYRPTKYRFIPKDGGWAKATEVEVPIPGGHGMFWEADEAARCIRDGKKESATIPHDESVLIMEVMDEVRKQGGLEYDEKIITTDFPVQLDAKK